MKPTPCIPVDAEQRARHRGYAGADLRVRWLWRDADGRLHSTFWGASR